MTETPSPPPTSPSWWDSPEKDKAIKEHDEKVAKTQGKNGGAK